MVRYIRRGKVECFYGERKGDMVREKVGWFYKERKGWMVSW